MPPKKHKAAKAPNGRCPMIDLPPELLPMISDQLNRAGMQNFRLTNRLLSAVVTPQLMSSVGLYTTSRKPHSTGVQADRLAYVKLTKCAASSIATHIKSLSLGLMGEDVHVMRRDKDPQNWKNICLLLERLATLDFVPAYPSQKHMGSTSAPDSTRILQASKNLKALAFWLPTRTTVAFGQIFNGLSFDRLQLLHLGNAFVTEESLAALVLQHSKTLKRLELRNLGMQEDMRTNNYQNEWEGLFTRLLTGSNLEEYEITSRGTDGDLEAFQTVYGDKFKESVVHWKQNQELRKISWKKSDTDPES